MRATAQFERERAADVDNAHVVPVVLTEQRHRAHGLGLVQIGDEGVDGVVGLDRLVGDVLDLLPLRLRERSLPAEVETQVSGPVQRARLNGIGPQYLPQRGVHHVRARVALSGAVAPLRIHRGHHLITLDELTGFHRDLVHEEGFGDLLNIGDLRLRCCVGPVAANGSDVGDLATRFRVERGAVQYDFRLGARRGDRHPGAVDKDAQNRGLRIQFVEPGEFRGARVHEFAVCRQVRVGMLACGGIGLGTLPLLVHQLTEAVLVHRKPGLGGHFEGELDGESVGVVQGERVATRKRAFSCRFRLVRGILEQLRTGGQGPVERGLLGNGDSADAFEVGYQLGVRGAHLVTHHGHQLTHHGLFDAKQLGGADDPAQQAAQHIAAAFIAGADPVADDDRRRAGVVADDAVAHVVLMTALPVPARGNRCHTVDDRAHQVGLVDVVDTLQQTRDALDTHAGVDVLARQRAEYLEVGLGGPLAALVLHEHEIPDLDVAVLVGLRAAFDAVLGAAVVVDL